MRPLAQGRFWKCKGGQTRTDLRLAAMGKLDWGITRERLWWLSVLRVLLGAALELHVLEYNSRFEVCSPSAKAGRAQSFASTKRFK